MGTKLHPGEFDCFRAALPDEPMFILLARDESAPDKLRSWADQVRKRLVAEKVERPQVDDDPRWVARYEEDMRKARDADFIAHDMEVWRANNLGAWRNPSERPVLGDIDPALKFMVAEVTKARLCSCLILGGAEVSEMRHDVRSWSVPGFNVRVHTLVYQSSGGHFEPALTGRRPVAMTDWHINGFDVQLGDVQCTVPDADNLVLQLQVMEATSG